MAGIAIVLPRGCEQERADPDLIRPSVLDVWGARIGAAGIRFPGGFLVRVGGDHPDGRHRDVDRLAQQIENLSGLDKDSSDR